jgi:nucleoside recognition membrane protein YjiH
MTYYLIIGSVIFIFAFALYLLIDLGRSNMNAFLDKWVGKTAWIWLPFYALQRLIREVILKK